MSHRTMLHWWRDLYNRKRRPMWAIAASIVIAVALSGCLIDTTPQTPTPPTATPTPRPTPTPTVGFLPIRQPTFPPTAIPRVSATEQTNVIPENRASGQILFVATQGARRDILTVEANGQDRRQLVTGTYDAPTWSPDGTRFAAFGATTSGGLADQLALFDGNGRALARYPLAGIGVSLSWSGDGQALLCFLRDPAEISGARSAWIADANGLEQVPLPDSATPWRWAPNNRVAYVIYPPGGQSRASQSSPVAVWSIDRNGDQPRKEAEGTIVPLGWSPNGQTFYALDGLLIPQVGQPNTRATGLIAVDRRSGTTRTIVAASKIANGGIGSSSWFEGATIAPAGGEIALWLRVVSLTSASQLVVALIDDDGRLLTRDILPAGVSPAGFAWSTGGILLTYVAVGPISNDLHIINPGQGATLTYPVSAEWSPNSAPPSWSPDSRWVVLVSPSGITIVAAVGEARTFTIFVGTALTGPAWRPATIR